MTILVVDDNALVCEVVRLMLEARGHDVLIADGGSKALNLFSESSIDLALVDVDMPTMNGLEVCSALLERANALGHRVLVWLMTGVMRPEVSESASRLGAHGIIPKPFTTAELVSRIETSATPASF